MKRRSLIVIVLFCSVILFGQKRFVVAPAYVAIKLIDQESSADVCQVGGYYGFVPIGEDGYLLKDSLENEIYIYNIVSEMDTLAVVRLTTSQKRSDVIEALQLCGFSETKQPRYNIPDIKGIRLQSDKKVGIVADGKPTVLYLLKE